MQTRPIRFALAAAALLGAARIAFADPLRTECWMDEGIPEFVTRRIELVTGARAPGGDRICQVLGRDPDRGLPSGGASSAEEALGTEYGAARSALR